MLYLIQSDSHGVPVTELGYQTIEACDYYNWYNNTDEASVELLKPDKTRVRLKGRQYAGLYKDIVTPVGTIEWVEKFLGKNIHPLNIPKELAKTEFIRRSIGVGSRADIENTMYNHKIETIFVKSNTKCKSMIAQIFDIDGIKALSDNQEYFYSNDISDFIESEWRVFVQRGNILDCRMYIGDWYSSKPEKSIIEAMVREYKSCPPAYTLDIANIKTSDGIKPVIIEVHNFISCGLYGFDDKRRILSMLTSSYRWEQSN